MDSSAPVAVLIPAYNPGRQLLALISELRANGLDRIAIVDDGSSAQCEDIFAAVARDPRNLFARHAVNLGKGAALKTGMNAICLRWPDAPGIVTADSDGQHRAEDILRIARTLLHRLDTAVLGCRQFEGAVPWKSRLGNRLTAVVFRAVAGLSVQDTQTGLRGFPLTVAKSLLSVAGQRYEYELNVLLALHQWRVPIVEEPIATVYFDSNRGSHFSPIIDSLAIYGVLLRFAASSLLSSLVDCLIFVSAFGSVGDIALSMIVGRLGSSMLNLALNREFVFQAKGGRFARQVAGYYSLVLILGLTSYAIVHAAWGHLGVDVVRAKILAEALLFPISFLVQRDLIFRGARSVQSAKTTYDMDVR